ncbi:MAG: penicillin-binding protein 2 [Desulfovibrionaceae bacterium]|nr:penicillin-binding protein 2 [Desulfovibrionaceae bacterium]
MKIELEGEGYQPSKPGLIFIQCLVLALFVTFVLRFWYLQIHMGEEFAERASSNRLHYKLIYAPRGFLQDRNGVLLAENLPAFALTLNQQDCPDITATISQVSNWTGIPAETLLTRYQQERQKSQRPEPISLIVGIPFDQVAKIEPFVQRMPELSIETRTRRNYPHGALFAHILGYVAEANEKEMERDPDLSLGDDIGKLGLESKMEKRLRGQKGRAQEERNAYGVTLSSSIAREAQSGDSITLSLDLEVQKLAVKALGEHSGCIVVMEPYTGKVIALVTQPSFDNNAFSTGLTSSQWDELRNNPRFPMQNRTIQSEYPPGSVWKLVTAGVFLKEGINPNETVFCSGAYRLGNRNFRCWKQGGHGSMSMKAALMNSCDVYFYHMSDRVGIDKISAYARACGFGAQTGIDLPYERGGLVPSREWKRQRTGSSWQRGETLNVSIGQGATLVTPLQVAVYTSALLNGGYLLKPSLILSEPPQVTGKLPSTPEEQAFLVESMRLTAESGTARVIARPDAVMGGKTGTAQVRRIDNERLKTHQMAYEHRDHAWITTWAQKGDKSYVITVMVEHGGGGSTTAGPVARDIYRYLLDDAYPGSQPHMNLLSQAIEKFEKNGYSPDMQQ